MYVTRYLKHLFEIFHAQMNTCYRDMFEATAGTGACNHTNHGSPTCDPSDCIKRPMATSVKCVYILRGLSPHANYTDRAAAAGRRS